MPRFRFLFIAAAAWILSAAGSSLELSNGAITVSLERSSAGTPEIAGITLAGTRHAALSAAEPVSFSRWFPEDLLSAGQEAGEWQRIEHAIFQRAGALVPLAKGLFAVWTVDLPPQGAIVRMHVRILNRLDADVSVPWFPAWTAAWKMPGWADELTWWKSLSFENETVPLDAHTRVNLASHVHSSDTIEDGVNPYWRASGKKGDVYCSLDWCGGWRAEIEGVKKGLGFRVFLPEDETQLLLKAGESIGGPVLMAMFARGADEAQRRADWMQQRRVLAETLYGGPSPSFPLSWNHWYTVRFDLSAPFIEAQVAAMAPYGFDYFIVDAGWYEACGQWHPDPAKFAPGQFEAALRSVSAQGVTPGIWTCPQFVHAPSPEADEPGFYRKFIDGHLLDMAGMDFTAFLLDHVAALRSDYQAGWWKYDQDFFTENETRHGRMKNVAALQEALTAVRKANPGLYIENCQSGGRMLNEFTVLMAQGQWIRDGGGGEMKRARANIQETLGALEFLPPWTAIRWTNRPEENDPNDVEFMKTYCRSAMAGVWGIVSDLPKVSPGQRECITEETKHYRRMSPIKQDACYTLYPAQPGASAAGAVFFNAQGTQAAILLLRWDETAAFTFPVAMPHLSKNLRYRVEDVDTKEVSIHAGKELRKKGLNIPFPAGRQSALLFIAPGK